MSNNIKRSGMWQEGWSLKKVTASFQNDPYGGDLIFSFKRIFLTWWILLLLLLFINILHVQHIRNIKIFVLGQLWSKLGGILWRALNKLCMCDFINLLIMYFRFFRNVLSGAWTIRLFVWWIQFYISETPKTICLWTMWKQHELNSDGSLSNVFTTYQNPSEQPFIKMTNEKNN